MDTGGANYKKHIMAHRWTAQIWSRPLLQIQHPKNIHRYHTKTGILHRIWRQLPKSRIWFHTQRLPDTSGYGPFERQWLVCWAGIWGLIFCSWRQSVNLKPEAILLRTSEVNGPAESLDWNQEGTRIRPQKQSKVPSAEAVIASTPQRERQLGKEFILNRNSLIHCLKS